MKQEVVAIIIQFEKIRLDYKEIYFKNNLSDKKFDGQFINHVDKTIIFLNLNLQNFADNLLNKQIFDRILPTDSINDYNSVLQNYYTQTKSSFIYNFVSIVENYFRNIYSVIFPNNKTRQITITKILKDIFNYFGIAENDEWNALSILLKIRNTIHNNGYYCSKNEMINYKSYIITFINGQPHTAAHFEILADILVDIKNLFLIIHSKIKI
ncbi:hypothetical protein DRF62_16220 [Chryseobacterium piscium]|uniref:RiboL-PSP-HEPN domain-containing protein n=1 Tax=Chryseobacterium piscium TaxID=333702 RepID=A0A3D9BER4_9FLAO|nr:hypothetical protein [Chryseobacterium piscium]REC52019.1 hypothetical protein DRF62_16220 [Chryseobacterium piscium]